jgi:hypothetical protein
MKRLAVPFALALSVLAGCDWPFQSDYRERLVWVWDASAPDTVEVGSAFEVALMSSGTNGCWRKGRDDVRRVGPLLANITPHDLEYVGSDGCTDDTPNFRHSINLTPEARGLFQVRVVSLTLASTGRESLRVIPLTIVVR